MNNAFPAMQSGTVEGTGSAINVELGFTPRYVKLINIDDAGGLDPTLEWFTGMAAAAGLKGKSIADNGATSALSQEYVTSGGITAYAGSDTPGSEASPGFTIGADSDINASGETILWIAFR